MNEAMYGALRVRPRRPTESLAAMYEYPYGNWGPGEMQSAGKFYVDISAYIESKLAALEAYSTQLHPNPYPLSLEGARRLAALRGVEVGVPYAELFYVVRMIM